MSDISPSAVKVTPALEEALKNADASEISSIMRREMLAQGLVREAWDASILEPVEQPVTPAPKRFAKTAEIAGNKMVFEGDSEIEVERQIGAAYKTAAVLQSPATTTQQTEQPRDASGRFTSPAESVISEETKAGLQLRLSLGQITMSEYLEQSGAVGEYLAHQGIDMEDLKATVAEKQTDRLSHAWESSVQEFLAGSGNWWPGGAANLSLMQKTLTEMGAESEPSAENLRRAAEYLRDSNQLVEPPEIAEHNREIETHTRISGANSVEEIRQAVGYQHTSGLFGR